MSAEMVYYLVCKECGHRKSSFILMREQELISPGRLPSLQELELLRARFKCSACDSKKITFEGRQSVNGKITYVATTESEESVFHKSTCGWMRHVSSVDTIYFRDRNAAVRQGYRPCKACKP
jgi:hypothetical protein